MSVVDGMNQIITRQVFYQLRYQIRPFNQIVTSDMNHNTSIKDRVQLDFSMDFIMGSQAPYEGEI